MQRIGLCALLAALSFGAAGCGGEGEKAAPPPANVGVVDANVPPADGKAVTPPAAAPGK